MKLLSVALVSLGLSLSIFASLPATTDPAVVDVPQLPGGFAIGGTIYFLQPSLSNGDFDYATVIAGGSLPNTSSVISSVEPSYDWDWGINIGYIFPQTGNDIAVRYLDFKDNSSDNTATLFLTNLPDSFSITPFNGAVSKTVIDLDQVDVTAGQYVNVGCRLMLHPNIGLRYLDLSRKRNDVYALATPLILANVSFIDNEKSSFTGVGPLAGLDASYYLGDGVGIVGHFASALAIGDINSNFNKSIIVSPTGEPVTAIALNSRANSNQRIVPNLDGKLGFDYMYIFNSSNRNLTFEAGYQMSKYFDAVDTLHTTFSDTPLSGRSTANLALQGPYMNLTLHI